MTKRGTFRAAGVEGRVEGGITVALILADVAALPVFLLVASGVVHDVATCFDAGATLSTSQKAEPTSGPAIRLVLFPLVLYLVYFMNFGRTTKQARIAGWSFVIIVSPCLAYLVYALEPRLPGGYADFEMVIGALLLLYFCGCLLFGTILRWRIIVGSAKKRYPLCQRCGYNLTGLTEARCPECGIPFDPKLLADQPQPSPQREIVGRSPMVELGNEESGVEGRNDMG